MARNKTTPASKSKSAEGTVGGRKLAAGAGRAKAKSGGETKKPASGPRPRQRTGASKQRKG